MKDIYIKREDTGKHLEDQMCEKIQFNLSLSVAAA